MRPQSHFASVAELRAGRMIILVDDEARENEGDLVVAAEKLEIEHVVAMNRIASGIITVPMPRDWLRRLHIDPRDGLGERLDVHGFEIRRPELQHLGAQHERTPGAGDVTVLFQRKQPA